jgi:hypothetical protein
MPRNKRGVMQSVIIKRGPSINTLRKARKEAKDYGAKTTDKYDKTSTSYRFRQFLPGHFYKKSFKTARINKDVSIVYGNLKKKYK